MLVKTTSKQGNFYNELYHMISENHILKCKPYFRPDILNLIKEKEASVYIPVSASAYRINEELYSYNKDRDQSETTWSYKYLDPSLALG